MATVEKRLAHAMESSHGVQGMHVLSKKKVYLTGWDPQVRVELSVSMIMLHEYLCFRASA